MNNTIFNFHDVILLMTATQCLFFSLLILLTRKSRSDLFLSGFVFALAFIPIHELILWGYEFKIFIRENYPGAYFITGFSYYIDTVLLYLYVKSLTSTNLKIRRIDAIHLTPLLIFVVYMSIFFYAQPYDQRVAMINDESFVYSKSYLIMELIGKLIRTLNCLYCLKIIKDYRSGLEATQSRVEEKSIIWLKIFIVFFTFVTTIEFVLNAIKLLSFKFDIDVVWFEILGLSGYYSLFFTVNILAFVSIRLFSHFSQVDPTNVYSDTKDEPELNEHQVKTIKRAMNEHAYYLDPNISIDALAKETNIPVKNVSAILNRRFNKNFYEFINHYRIEEAKKRLRDSTHQHKTITDIYLDVGFNSKSVFNTFFKKLVGVTPTHFRKNGPGN